MTARYLIDACLARIDAAEYGICRRINRGASPPHVRQLFAAVSWLGNGAIWYALLVVVPLLYGAPGLRVARSMALTCIIGLLLYRWLKGVVVRERPFITHASISRGAAPLDRYSFPSGHTLHAVAFTWQAVAAFPELGWVLVPLAAMIAASRVVLGLHYPTDVLAGAALGAGIARIGMALT